MNNAFKTALVTSAILLSASVANSASAAETLEIRNFIGTIHWTNGPMNVDVKKNAGAVKITSIRSIRVDGGEDRFDGEKCESSYGVFSIDLFGKERNGSFGGYEGLKDLPILHIEMPEDTELKIQDSIIFTDGTPNIGAADLEFSYCGSLSLGDVNGPFVMENLGSMDVDIGDSHNIVLNLKGSGDFTAEDSGDVRIESKASADVTLGNIEGLDGALQGSGDFEADSVSGDVILTSNGSGDISFGGRSRSLSFKGRGSGGLSAGDSGNTTIRSHGSGEVDIGDIRSLDGSTFGSGDLTVGDVNGETVLSSKGSGDIELDNVSGSLSFIGDGSGDLVVESLTGNYVDLKTRGSGGVDIGDGQVETLIVSAGGSGRVKFSGEAASAHLRSTGSGGIRVDRVKGSLETSASGSGDVKVLD